MMRSLFSGVSGLKNHQTGMDVTGNNIANVNTTGFKASRTIFKDIVSQTISNATAPNGNTGGMNSKQVGLGMAVSTISKDITEGSSQSTDVPLDFKIEGEGYFVVQNADGSYSYTRNGNFSLDKDGYLVNANGQHVMGIMENSGTPTASTGTTPTDLTSTTALTGTNLVKLKITGKIPADSGSTYNEYAIDSNGIITAKKESTTTATVDNSTYVVGRVALATFNNPAGLDAQGNSLMTTSANSGDPVYSFVNELSAGTIQSGELEMSNVSLATELTNMIILQRGFQANSRVITTSDTMLEELVNLKR
jgi:fagellar hook-basal body proteins